MDNLASPTHTRPDPFDTSQIWPETAITLNNRPNYDMQPVNRSNYDVRPVSRLNNDKQSVSRPNYDTQSVSRPNYDTQSVSRPNYETQPVSRPNYDTQSVSRPIYDTQPVSRPKYGTQPVSRPNYDIQPVNRSNYDSQPVNRSNYDIQPSHDTQIEISHLHSESQQNESHRYLANNYALTSDSSHLYDNETASRNNSQYGSVADPNASSTERNPPNLTTSLADMSLDDRISESLNLRNNENIYSNTQYQSMPSTSAGPSNVNENRYNDIPIYSNFDIHPSHQQFLLETKDYYTKYSTPAKTNTNNDYEKNIYVPKYEDEAEKLKNFSECLENSKNYSALKYQNVDYGYPSYSNNYGNDSASASRTYDEVNDTASNFYSEISDSPSVYGTTENVHANASLYDDVYEESVPRPHRPAPPCPSKPK